MDDCGTCRVDLPAKRAYLCDVLVEVGHWLPEIPRSRHRSRRVWKKLVRRGATPMHEMRMVLTFEAAPSR